MSINTSGLIFKGQHRLFDDEVLGLMAFPGKPARSISIHRATSVEFEDLAVLNEDKVVWVFGRNLTWVYGFEAKLQPFEERLVTMSRFGDVLSYHFGGYSDTYAWALYRGGARACSRIEAPNIPRLAIGELPPGWVEPVLGEDGILELVAAFGGVHLGELLDKRARVYRYAA